MDFWANRALDQTAERTAAGKVTRRPDSRPAVGGETAASYPSELEEAVALHDGAQIRIRPIRPEDEAALQDLYTRLSEYTAYQRFFTVLRRLPTEWFHHFANVDYRSRLALVAEHAAPEGAGIVGVGRYEPTDDGMVAEVAFVVEDAWQGRGVGAVLFDRLLAAAERRGIRRFRAYVLASNHRMLELIAAHAHVEERKTEDGVTALTFSR